MVTDDDASVTGIAQTMPCHGVPPLTPSAEISATPSSPRQDTLASRQSGNVSTGGRTLLSSPITQLGQLVGTPAYVAPEQFAGRTADARSDQFSFCVALHEALYGQRPFAGDTLKELKRNLLAGTVVPARKSRRVPSWLRRVLLQGLAPDRNNRFESMSALLRALSRDPERRRAKRLSIAAAVVSLALVAAVGLFTWSSTRVRCDVPATELAGIWDEPSKRNLKRALMASGAPNAGDVFERVRGNLDLFAAAYRTALQKSCAETHRRRLYSENVLDARVACLRNRRESMRALVDELRSQPDKTVLRKAIQASLGLPEISACMNVHHLQQDLPIGDRVLRRRVEDLRDELARAKAVLDLGRSALARQRVEELLRDARQIDWPVIQGEFLVVLGATQAAAGDYQLAERSYTEARQLAASTKHARLFAEATLAWLWTVGYQQGHTRAVARWFDFFEAAATWSEHDADLQARYWRTRGAIAYLTDDADEAVRCFKQSLRLSREAGGRQSHRYAEALSNLASAQRKQGKYDLAEANFKEAIALEAEFLGDRHPKLTIPIGNLGNLLVARGKLEQGEAHLRRALEIREEFYGAKHPLTGGSIADIGNLMLAKGQLEQARHFHREALQILEETVGPDHREVIKPLVGLATVCQRELDHRRALPLLQRALLVDERSSGATGVAAAETLELMATSHLALKQTEPARVALERALQILETHASSPRRLADLRAHLASVLWIEGTQPQRAKSLARLARETLAVTDDPDAERTVAEIDTWLAP